MKTQKQPYLTLVGAGPGDPELITLKGIQAIKKADVILYDALANEELLEYASPKAKLIPVGKRSGKHSFTQDKINQLIVSYAFTYGHVVRLKGGDPFVFGRGFEEIQFAEAFGIPSFYIPGISSSIAVPGLAGIPVTHRGSSKSFFVVTATDKNGNVSNDLLTATKAEGTVVILMGLSKLDKITEEFIRSGKQDEPVAIIQNGSLPDENIVYGTFNTIVDSFRENRTDAPGIIITGAVVREPNSYFEQLGLAKLKNYSN